jgi:hypothetical protein
MAMANGSSGTPDVSRLEHQRGNAQAAFIMTRHLVDKYSEALQRKELEGIRQLLEKVDQLLREGAMPQIEDALTLLDEVRDRILRIPALGRNAN